MNNKIINYRGATTTVNDVQAENSSHADALENSNPELSYRGSHSDHVSVMAENQKHNEDLLNIDPTITYRGTSVKYSEIHG